ncbi:amidohydrolase family protein [Rhodohalobacter sp. 614A]|uniref:amidohydrolase family protein n=1 Tax=Rhodohalobacter sp. 614A TaxID=2908649 RepID=UPI001F3171F1|nr:amidohydrolase family protein [Rhodohalobacter sp. 614A]
MKIDAHQHFWKFDPVRDAWIDDSMEVIRRDFMPEDLEPVLKKTGFDGCISVQADQSEEETYFLLNLAEKHDFIKGVVGWVDLKAPNLNQRLEHFSQYDKLKGFRHILQGQPTGTMLDDSFIAGIETLQQTRFRYDILIFENQLHETVKFVERVPEMNFVIDHIAKPTIKESSFDDWAAHMKKLAGFPHVHVKLSGMVTEADWNHWKKNEFTPYLETCLELFGADRLMIGSDWPVCLLAGEYDEVIGIVEDFLDGLSAAEYDNIMGISAAKFYQLM